MKPIHPFPARMAPEILEDKLAGLGRDAAIWDPMCGSGTSLRVAASLGIRAVGTDTDPLAVKMARVGTRRFDAKALSAANEIMEDRVRSGRRRVARDSCAETQEFKNYWFAETQQQDLALIARQIETVGNPELREFYEIALSRIIITKFRGASLAWDVSHSRPHRVRTENDFDTRTEFMRSCQRLAAICVETPPRASVIVEQGDARTFKTSTKVELVVTSPPYLNAIDYMRGHKLSLVWLGWTIPQLRELRSNAIGTERRLDAFDDGQKLVEVERVAVRSSGGQSRITAVIRRYISDCAALMTNIRESMASASELVMVVADSNVRGHTLNSAKLFEKLAIQNGLRKLRAEKRGLPASKRYLPTDTDQGIGNRMKTEHILHFST